MTPYVFFLDIDDTILYKNTISPRVLSAMKLARQKGHFVYINTGRAPSFFDNTLRTLPVDGYVCGCGALVLQNGKVLYQAEYPTEALIRWMKQLTKPEDPGFVIEGEKRIFRYRNSYWRPWKEWVLSDSVEEFHEYLTTDTVVKASICNDIDPCILPALEQDFHVIYHPTEHYTECCPKGCSKATGMEIIMKHHGLEMRRSVAIGDSENDLDMLCAAGIGVVMGQARDEIKQYADRITASVTEDGAAVAIEELIREK
ncbi:MAG: HAD family phosphatase [Clostridia bacterium]|nr:HAD family phosphatase [Clostridia bacterium]